MSCRKLRPWLHRDAASLDEAQRLMLEDHLTACARCRGDRARLRLLHRVGTSLQAPPPGAREYQRAIARALLEGARPEARASTRRWASPFAFAAAAAAAAAVIAVAWIALRGEELQLAPASTERADIAATAPAPAPAPPPAPAPSPAPAAPPQPPAQIERGALRDGTTRIASGDAVPAKTLLRATEPTRMRLASSLVVVAASAELRWLPAERTLLLEQGSLDIETTGTGVDRIATARFEVEFGDASLAVAPTAVRVRRGTARIVDRGTRAIVARLAAGSAWEAPQPAAQPARPTASRTPGAPSAAQLLAQARARFAAKDTAGAARAAEAALASTPSRTEQAEAHTVLADVAQASGDLAQAAARYGSVSTKFADLPAAESALYAAARLELRRGRRTEARALLTRYLERYPSGRYTGDVRRQLTSIP